MTKYLISLIAFLSIVLIPDVKAAPITCADITQIPQAECQALQDIRNWEGGISTEYWFRNEYPCRWNTADHPYSRPYIICTEAQTTVVSLRLQQIPRLRAIPPSIGNFTNLHHLGIIGTGIQQIPPEIGRLSNLQSLAIGRYDVEESRGGACCGSKVVLIYGNPDLKALPKEIGNLQNLRSLTTSRLTHM